MEHEKQVEVVKQALELETQIQVLEQFLPEERAETYAEPEPQPPVRQEAHYTEPPIRHGCKVNWLLMLGPAGMGECGSPWVQGGRVSPMYPASSPGT